MNKVIGILRNNLVPILFIIICLIGILYADMPIQFLLWEIITRIARNSFLVLSLIIPVIAGMGLNFGIVLGALAGQVAIILSTHWQWAGLGGLAGTVVLALPFAIIFGYLAGRTLNRAKGREMIASMVMGFFANGLYQFAFLFLVGTVINIDNPTLRVSAGPGLRNTIELKYIKQVIDNLWTIRFGMVPIPVITIGISVILCVVLIYFFRTKLGQDLRAVGQDRNVAEISGLNVNGLRILAVVISTVLAAWGQIIFLQNIGTLNTYNSHEQVGTFAIAALLIGGATVAKATIFQALLGTVLFHTLFVVSPMAGKAIFGDAQIGEYFRVFIAYGIIAASLAIHAWQTKTQLSSARKKEKAAINNANNAVNNIIADDVQKSANGDIKK